MLFRSFSTPAFLLAVVAILPAVGTPPAPRAAGEAELTLEGAFNAVETANFTTLLSPEAVVQVMASASQQRANLPPRVAQDDKFLTATTQLTFEVQTDSASLNGGARTPCGLPGVRRGIPARPPAYGFGEPKSADSTTTD